MCTPPTPDDAASLTLIERLLDPPPATWRARIRRWFGPPAPSPALALIRIASLFDGPIDAAAFAALRAPPVIAGLTEALHGRPKREWEAALERLGALGVIDADTLHAPAPVRAWFGAAMQASHPRAWKQAHTRLYHHYAAAAPDKPDTLEAMQPLFRAVVHGCAAGRHREVMTEVYWHRIQRGHDFYLWHVLGAFEADEAALAAFFIEPWHRPHPALAAREQALMLVWAGHRLRALGQLEEALGPTAAGLARDVEQAWWPGAAMGASNLAKLLLCLGRFGADPDDGLAAEDAGVVALARAAVGETHGADDIIAGAAGAIAFARAAVEYADRSGDAFSRMSRRALLGEVLHQRGRLDEAAEVFEVAEGTQALDDPGMPLLYGLAGFRHGELLRALGRVDEARAKVERWREWLAAQGADPLEGALGELLMGRLRVAEAGDDAFRAAGAHFDAAVAGLRAAGQRDELPRGLLARAAWHRSAGDAAAARSDLDEAHASARAGGMRLHLADGFVEAAWQHLFAGDGDAARAAYAAARDEVEATGAHSRDATLATLAEAVAAR